MEAAPGWRPKPWIAVVLSLFFGPLGMLYVQRPVWAGAYLLAAVALAGLLFVIIFGGQYYAAALIAPYAGWALRAGAAIHSGILAQRPADDVRRWYSRWPVLISVFVVAVLGVFSFRAFYLETFRTPSESMYPTVPQGSFLFVHKWGYGNYGTFGITPFRAQRTAPLARGDIVVFHPERKTDINYVSRLIALPGDRIDYTDRRLAINGRPVPATATGGDAQYEYVTEELDGRSITIAYISAASFRGFDMVVPPGEYVVLGDNRDNANDSRYIGTIPEEDIVGVVAKTLPAERPRLAK